MSQPSQRHYELVILIDPAQSDQVPDMLQRWHAAFEKLGGTMQRSEDWGRRPLAYSIKHAFKAHYVLMNVTCTAEAMAEFEAPFKYNDAILRHLTLVRKEAMNRASPMMLDANKNHEGVGRRGGRIDQARIDHIEYMDVDALWAFLMENGRIIPSRMTGVSAKTQRRITHAVKLARYLSLIPYCDRHK